MNLFVASVERSAWVSREPSCENVGLCEAAADLSASTIACVSAITRAQLLFGISIALLVTV